MTFSTRKLRYAIFAGFFLCALTSTDSSAFPWPESSLTAVLAPSSDAEEPAAANAGLRGATLAPIADRIVGGEFDFVVAEGNSFTSIGSRFGESPKILARDNGKQVRDRLESRRNELHIDNRRYRSSRSIRFDRGQPSAADALSL